MNKLFLMFVIPGCFQLFAQEAVHSSTLTLGVGGTPYSYDSKDPGFQAGGPSFTGNYEYRLSKYLAVEGGADILLPLTVHYGQIAVIPAGQNLITYSGTCCSFVPLSISERSRITLLTYGFKSILPLAGNRLELFAGVGGAYSWNSESNGFLNTALAQASLGGRLAIDRGQRFWLGTTLRGLASFGPGQQAWVPLTFDLGIRLGR